MKTQASTLPIAVLCASIAAFGQGAAQPSKVGIIHIQNTIVATKDGQKALSELQARFEPKRKELEKKQGEVQALQEQLRKGSNTMSDDAKQKLVRDIDARLKTFNRDSEDAQTEWDQEQGKILNELGQKLMVVIDKYARDNGFALILDVSSPQSPVLYAANGIDITNDIVALYDKNSPGAAPAAVTPAAPKPVAPAAKKAPGVVK